MSKKKNQNNSSSKTSSIKKSDEKSCQKLSICNIRLKNQPHTNVDNNFTLTDANSLIPQPFLKWVGGKAQLITQFNEFFPKEIINYVEPFVGGGAVFFHLKHRFPQMRAFLYDINPELINAYVAVRDFLPELMHQLDEHANHFHKHYDDYFYFVRDQHHLSGDEKKIVERAARMIFLNKTCFNGVWRVNSRNEFNVPIGSTKTPRLPITRVPINFIYNLKQSL